MDKATVRGAILFLGLGLLNTGCQSTGAPARLPEDRGVELAADPVTRDIEAFLRELYRSFCFEPAGQADWAGMQRLFVPGASFASPIQPGEPVKVQDARGFLADFRNWIETSDVGRTGFYERILCARVDHFGNVAHAYVTFEGFVPGEDQAQTLGVDSLQLVLDRGAWKLASFTSQYVSKSEPLPAQFAPGSLGTGAQ